LLAYPHYLGSSVAGGFVPRPSRPPPGGMLLFLACRLNIHNAGYSRRLSAFQQTTSVKLLKNLVLLAEISLFCVPLCLRHD